MEAKNWIIVQRDDERFREGLNGWITLFPSRKTVDCEIRGKHSTAVLVFADIMEERSVPCLWWIPEGLSLQHCVVWTYVGSSVLFGWSVDQLMVHMV